MSRILVITSGKGGVGKTTVTVNVGAGLAGMGYRVLLIDADVGLRNLDVALGQEDRVVYDFVDLVEGRCTREQAIIPIRKQPRLFLLPAAQTKEKADITPQYMKDMCANLRPLFDFIIIDAPAGIDMGFKNAIAAADTAVIVTTPGIAAVRDADRVIGLLELAGVKEQWLILNRIRMDMIKKGDMLNIDNIIDILGIGTIGLVPEDEEVLASGMRGTMAVGAEGSRAGEAFMNIARRLCGESVPIVDLEDRRGLAQKFKKLFGF